MLELFNKFLFILLLVIFNQIKKKKIFLIERSIFDFMGFMFGMIIADVFYLIFLIIGLFGAYQYRVNYVAMVCSFLYFYFILDIEK